MYWIGNKASIEAAEALASVLVVGIPEVRDGILLPEDLWVTSRWDIPTETASGLWYIKAHPDVELPDGCSEVDVIE